MSKDLNPVTAVEACAPSEALAHFEARLSKETDCWDVHSTESRADRGFVLLDVRSTSAYEAGHLPGAVSLPHSEIDEESLRAYAEGTLFVVYCAGPHCNGANRAAIRLARLARPVKEMIGGITGWLDEGFALDTGGGR